ncbi:TetR/AcrR family transcriptional regulator [Streptomyces sp. NPDC059002]|uniref:TetR/AcrR family transcriptional regulator n=1 Tax=Streptomyces sp. NPDC059002 TaxID=3346690 RepID=UPI003689F2CD
MEVSRRQILAAAHELFYAHGVRAVTMQQIRDVSRVPLNRLYKTFPSKDDLVVAYLDDRDRLVRDALGAALAVYDSPREKVLGVFSWMYEVFRQPDFRGCVFTNTYGELGADSPAARIVVRHKGAIRELLTGLVREVGVADADALGVQLQGLWDGAIILATMTREPDHALHSRATAQTLLAAAEGDRH